MDKFKLEKSETSSVNRSIRFSKSTIEKLSTISMATGISVNKIVVKCVDFALKNMGNK